MNKLKAGIYKEFLLLIHDKVGLSMMFFLPIILVIVITSIQNSAFNLVNNNQIELIVNTHDNDPLTISFVEALKESGAFRIVQMSGTFEEINSKINNTETPFGIDVSSEYARNVKANANVQLNRLMVALGTLDSNVVEQSKENQNNITLIYNPIIQANYAQSIKQLVYTIDKKLTTSYFVNTLATELDIDKNIFQIDEKLNNSILLKKSSDRGVDTAIPNASEHNVPAWSIFAVFFMVVSLAGNLVKEKVNGSFDRVLTMPSSIWILLSSKAVLFWMVSLVQVLVIFLISRFVFQFIGIPTLYFPNNMIGFIFAIMLTGLTAVTFSLLIGVYSKTSEQANGFGALSTIILAAIGGIWVPSFILPSFLKSLSNISPLHWCIEMFYTIFLKDGSFIDLLFPASILLLINIIFATLIFFKLKSQNIICNG